MYKDYCKTRGCDRDNDMQLASDWGTGVRDTIEHCLVIGKWQHEHEANTHTVRCNWALVGTSQ